MDTQPTKEMWQAKVPQQTICFKDYKIDRLVYRSPGEAGYDAFMQDVYDLSALARRTFYDTFAHCTDPDDMREYLASAYDPELLASEISHPCTELYLARFVGAGVGATKADKQGATTEKGVAAGYIKVNWADAQTEPEPNDHVELQRIYVDEPHKGTGLAQKLYDLCLDRARERHAQILWLGVWEDNKRARRFYEKQGFVVTGEHHFQVGTDDQIDLVMKLTL